MLAALVLAGLDRRPDRHGRPAGPVETPGGDGGSVAGGTALHPRDRRHRRAGRDRRGLALFAALLACAYLWDICDALGSERWRRRLSRPEPGRVPDSDLPFISLHVPAHNEPPDMVLDTLRSLLRLDYPRFEVIVIDDNTDEEALWRPLEAWCARHGAKFRHLEDWPGYKSGALNYALREMTDPRAEIIGVVDSDYQLEPGLPPALRAAVCRRLGWLRPGAAGLPRLAPGPLLPQAVLQLPVLLRGLPAVTQRA
jgi:hypothetical protein